jgi:serine/threonine protein kinase
VDCPTEDTLLAVVEGRLGDDSGATYEHVQSCSGCRLLLNELARSYGRDEDQLRPGQRVGRYVLRALIGMGGMGVVYSAHDPELKRDVAIKLLRTDLHGQPGHSRARLLREAQAMAKLSHPNVIAVHDVGLHGEQVFVAMELIEGQTLRQWLGDGRHRRRETLGVLILAGRGLAAAHEVGIVHRDFKPDNVMIGRNGSVRVLDFGLARAVANENEPLSDGGGALTHSLSVGAMVGTPAYMAPEQLACEATDARSDQFSFCIALYQSLTGSRPFAGKTPKELLAAIRQGRKDSVAEAQIPSWLRPILARGLRAQPDERFASMSELLAALERDPAAARRRRLMVAGAALAFAAIGAIGYQQSRRHASLLCQGAGPRMAEVWFGARKQQIEAWRIPSFRGRSRSSTSLRQLPIMLLNVHT